MFSGLARQGGAPGVPRTCSSDMYSDMLKQLSAYSKEPGESGGSAAWRGRNVNTNGTCVGTCVEALCLMQGFSREFLHSRYLSL